MKKIISGVYKITNIENNRSYVGSSENIYGRWNEHKNDLINNEHHSIKLQRSYNKRGVNKFVYEIIIECEPIKEILLENEQYYMNLYECYKNGYNCTKKAGSRLGSKASEETKIKMSENRKGEKHPMFGKHHSEKAKKTTSVAQKYLYNTGYKNPMLGKNHSDVTKSKIRETKKQNFSEETRKKMSDAQKGKTHTDEHKAKISKSLKGRVPWNKGRKMLNIV